jgi:hypothetical protein
LLELAIREIWGRRRRDRQACIPARNGKAAFVVRRTGTRQGSRPFVARLNASIPIPIKLMHDDGERSGPAGGSPPSKVPCVLAAERTP